MGVRVLWVAEFVYGVLGYSHQFTRQSDKHVTHC